MLWNSVTAVVLMLLIPAGEPPENPWKEKVAAAVRRAEHGASVAALREALDVTWRADDWWAGLKLAQQALKRHHQRGELLGMVVRALWLAGQIEEAERLGAGILPKTADHVALRAAIELGLARRNTAAAEKFAAQLEELKTHAAEDLYEIFNVRLSSNRLNGAADLVRQAERATDPQNGYPENYVGESIEGVADFLDAVGAAPLNQITEFGTAPMPPLVMLNLPSCEVYLNGHGPYRMVVDTGGSITLALDQAVADEVGLKSFGKASVRGVSGKQESSQVLVDDLQIGTIKCRRVVGRAFDVRKAIMNAADGIVGTGIFTDGRMTLDFAKGELAISRSSEQPGPGKATELLLVSDAKLIVPVTVEDKPGVAMLDTGADVVALAPSSLKRLFPDRKVEKFNPGMALGVGSEGTPAVSIGSGVTLQLAGRTFENSGGLGLDVLDDVLSPVIGVQIDILVGMPTFRDMKSCTVDFERGKMWIDWLK